MTDTSPKKKKTINNKPTTKKTPKKAKEVFKGGVNTSDILCAELGIDKVRNKGGRPSKYKEEYCTKMIEFMAKGYSYEAFAGLLGVNVDTLYEWEKVHSAFSEAKRQAFGKNRMFWEGQCIDNLSTGSGVTFNQSMWKFNMKNRFKWREQLEVEQIGDNMAKLLRDVINKQHDE